ncbi:hypothetical protein CY35_01G167500 [Sphagnum magellanicum]|nr:hypothetical protein CY35_01G167500 [Sphagnum magellanicum]
MRMKSQQYVGTCVKIFDMTGLGFSAFTRVKVLTAIATVDDLNYPEKTDVYYIVNAPYVFSACWKAVKPMLQDKTKQKVQILKDNGRDELLEVMDPDTLPLFCRGIRGEGSSSSSGSLRGYCDLSFNCFSSSHRFHVELYDYMLKESARKCCKDGKEPQYPVHIRVPSLGAQGESAELSEVVQVIKSVSTTLEAVEHDVLLDRNPRSSTSVAAIRGRSRQILWSILMILALYFIRGLLLD